MRWWRHLTTFRSSVTRHFPPGQLDAITAAVARAETERRGQIVVALEASLPLHMLSDQVSARSRAEQLFASLRVWNTEKNNGVLLYWLLADRQIEIIADRSAARQLAQSDWDAIAASAARNCAKGDHAAGILRAIEAIAARMTPDADPASESNELPDRPVLI
jgi:uncharacterized membrane protein